MFNTKSCERHMLRSGQASVNVVSISWQQVQISELGFKTCLARPMFHPKHFGVNATNIINPPWPVSAKSIFDLSCCWDYLDLFQILTSLKQIKVGLWCWFQQSHHSERSQVSSYHDLKILSIFLKSSLDKTLSIDAYVTCLTDRQTWKFQVNVSK